MLEANTIVPFADAISSRCPICGKVLEWYVTGDSLEGADDCFRPDSICVESNCCDTYFTLSPHDVVVEIQSN